MDIVKYLQAFIEGMALIVSPCILPVLPLILTSSVEGGRHRPYGVITGFILAFCLFALFSRQLVTSLGLEIEWLQLASYLLLFLFGLILLSTRLSERFSDLTQRFSDWGSRLSTKGVRNNDFWSGLLLGTCIGLIWTPCAGPILATVIVQIILQKSNIQGAIILFAFALGVGAPMLLIATGGQKMIQSLGFFRQHSLTVRRVLGIIILVTVIIGVQQGLILPSTAPQSASSASAKLMDALPSPY